MHICLFDIDGTLLHSGGAGKAAMERALESVFGVTAGTAGIPFSGRTDRAIVRDLFVRHGIEESAENCRRFLAAYLDHLPRTLATHPGKVLAGVAHLLEEMHGRGDVWLGLLTGNVREGARIKLSHFALVHYFRSGGYGDWHFHRDDVAREALAELRRHLGESLPGERIWVVGDTPLDVQCARAIGARVAAVATGWHPLEELAAAQPDLLLADLADPAPLLARLE
jgi:phosphoglycolate phosphatase-like HAD superfamily hydrolase